MSAKKKGATVHSMTGYGRGIAEHKGIAYDISLRSVNSRYLDLQFRAPRTFGVFEADVRECIQRVLHRGRVEVIVDRQMRTSADAVAVEVQGPLIRGLMKSLGEALAAEGVDADAAKERLFMEIIARYDVVRVEEDPDVSEKEIVLSALKQALEQLCAMREKEGEELRKDIQEKLADIARARELIASKRDDMVKGMQEKVAVRVKELLSETALDESRLIQEAAYLADRSDVSEELVRLESHLLQAATIFDVRPSGRKFEFLLQEIGRELNTIGSKAQQAEVQHLVVEAKSHMEKCREQSMNVE